MQKGLGLRDIYGLGKRTITGYINCCTDPYSAFLQVWVLDPIDGTKSFITGKPLFGTLIALLHCAYFSWILGFYKVVSLFGTSWKKDYVQY